MDNQCGSHPNRMCAYIDVWIIAKLIVKPCGIVILPRLLPYIENSGSSYVFRM